MAKQEKMIIWTDDIDMDDWNDYLDEEYPDVTDGWTRYSIAQETNDGYLEDERENLNIELENEIIVLADLGLWDGRRTAWKLIKSGNISDCLYASGNYYSQNEWYCDRYNFRGKESHHDGTNHYLYRVFRREVTEEQKERFEEALYEGKCNDRMIRRYTKSIRPYIAKVYGW